MLYLLVIINAFILVSGQILWKIGLDSFGGVRLANILNVIFSPYIIGGMLLYIVATGIWFIILSKADLSLVYPLQSIAYAIGVVAGVLIFKEDVSIIRWLGVSVILLGVYLVTIK